MSSLLGDPAISLARLSVAQYHQMIASGILLDGDPLELFEGVLVEKVTEGPAHAFRITRLTRLSVTTSSSICPNVIESYTAPISGDDARFGRHETLNSGRLDVGPVSVEVAELLG